jgi:YYY domain-containing protein
MAEVLSWWLVVTIGGAALFPIAFSVLPGLPDRGYAFTKALGLLLLSYLLWMGATIGVISNSRGAALLILGTLAVAGVIVWGRRRQEISAFLAEHWRYILFVEVLFAAAFFTAAWLRSFVPDIAGTEKPDEFAFLNAVLRTDEFPTRDPWLASYSLSYYYFGFVMAAALIKITGVSAAVGFNVALALTAALTVTAAFGVVYNLVASVASVRRAIIFGLVAVLLVTILGNLVGVLELMSVHGLGPSSLYTWAGIEGLTPDKSSTAWYPTEFFWWWRSTRVPGTFDVKEFPFFSFLLGDLHPHVMVMPFTLLAMGVGFNLLRIKERLDARWSLRHPLPFLLVMLILGSLSFLNAWSYPPTLALLALVVFARNWSERKGALKEAILDTASFIVPLTVGSVVLYLPFYWTSSGGLMPLAPVEAIVRPGLPTDSMVTQPKHLFLSMGNLLWLGTGLLIAPLSWRWLSRLGWKGAWALLPAAAPLFLWALLAICDLGFSRFVDELDLRGGNLLTLALLAALVTAAGLAFWRALTEEGEERDGLLLAVAAVGVSVLLLLGIELFFQLDHFDGPRTNTVFKIFHHSWLFLAVGGAFALYYVSSRLEVSELGQGVRSLIARVGGYTWAGVAVLLILAGLVYPLTATLARTNGFDNPQTLDGLAFARNSSPAEYEAVRWLNENVAGEPVILEAVGDAYTDGGRISSRTGLPTVLGWYIHEKGFRGGSDKLLQGRTEDVAQAYETTSVDDARAILQKYDIEYVYVGPFERQQYGETGLAKFGQFMELAFANSEVSIYRMPETVALGGAGLAN